MSRVYEKLLTVTTERPKHLAFFIITVVVYLLPQLNILKPIAFILLMAIIGSLIVQAAARQFKWLNDPVVWFGGSVLVGLWLLVVIMELATYSNSGLTFVALGWQLSFITPAIIAYLCGGTALPIRDKNEQWPKLTEYWPLAILTIAIIAIGSINPLAQNNDGFLDTTLQYWRGAPILASGLRPTYSAFQAAFAVLCGLTPLATYLWLPPLLFTLSLYVLFGYITDKKLILLCLAAPVILTEIFVTRPQAILLGLSVPIFILVTESVRHKSSSLAVAAAIVTMSLLPVHELSGIYLLAVLVAVLLTVNSISAGRREIFLKKVVIGLVIALPYFVLFSQFGVSTQFFGIIRHSFRQYEGLHFNLWFLDSYKSVDGDNLGWPGLGFIRYYLYNGILILLPAAVLLSIEKVRAKLLGRYLVPIYTIFVVFFFFAEIAPRFGFYFLLNRTWPYITLATFFVLVATAIRPSFLTKQYYYFGVALLAAAGLFGAILVAQDNVSLIYPNELNAAKFIQRQTDTKSLFLSTQNNETIVTDYGERRFIQLDTKYPNDPDQLVAQVLNELNTVNEVRTTVTRSSVDVSQRVVRLWDKTEITKNRYLSQGLDRPLAVYYIFSLTKTKGRSGERLAAYTPTSANSNRLLLNIADKVPVYQDNDVLIFKLY